mgnify:CR=1 FL=1
MREIRTLRAKWRELETEPRSLLNGHEGGNPGHGQASVLMGHRASSRPYVRPAKAGMFSGRKSRRGKSQKPRSLGCRRGGNEAAEANRQSHPWDGERVTGP